MMYIREPIALWCGQTTAWLASSLGLGFGSKLLIKAIGLSKSFRVIVSCSKTESTNVPWSKAM